MAWSTVFGNAQRNSYSGVSTELGALAWTFTFDTGEYAAGPPVVSAGGFIWVVTSHIAAPSFTWNFYLYCIKSDGTLQTKYTLQTGGTNPWVVGRLATLSNDVCCVPYYDGILFFPTGAPIAPTPPSTLTFLPSSWGLVYNDVLHILASEACNYVIVEAGGGTHTGDGTTDCRYVAPSSSGTYHIIATSIANPTWTATATIWVGSERTIADDSQFRFDAPAVDASDNIYYAWWDRDGTGLVKIVTLAPDASFVSEFSTGFGPTVISSAFMIAIDNTGIYIVQEDYPHSITSHTYLNKFDFSGTLLWQYDFGLTVVDFARGLTPSVQNGRVAVYGTDGGSFNRTFLINGATGVLIWGHTSTSGDNYSNGVPAPPQDADGTVYGGIFYNPFGTPRLSQLDAGTGTEQWSTPDPDGSSDGPGFPPVIGSDAFVQWPTQSLSRTAKSDGSESSRLDAIVLDNQPAFVTGRAYLTIDAASESQLLAYETSIPPVPVVAKADTVGGARALLTNSGVPIGGGAIHARSAGVSAVALLTNTNTACLEVYFAGVDNGDDFTVMVYSAPTELCLLNPVAGHEYILEAPAADLARFLGKRMGNVKFRRAGAGGNYSGAILLRAIELFYKTRTT